MKKKEIRDAPKVAPCSKKPECKGKFCTNPHCEEWRIFRNKSLGLG